MQTCCGRTFAEEAAFNGHQKSVHPHPARILVTSVDQFQRDLAGFVAERNSKGDWATVQGVTGAPDFVLGVVPTFDLHCPDCGRGFMTEEALNLHEDLVKHGDKAEKRADIAADSDLESWDDIRGLVREQLVERYREPTQNYCYIWIADMSSDWVVFEFKDRYFKTGYTLDSDGGVSFDDQPVEVLRRTVYVPAPTDNDKLPA